MLLGRQWLPATNSNGEFCENRLCCDHLIFFCPDGVHESVSGSYLTSFYLFIFDVATADLCQFALVAAFSGSTFDVYARL